MSCDRKVKIKFLNSNNIKQMLMLYSTSFRGVFRNNLNIYDGVFSEKLLIIFTKKILSQMFDWVLNMPLSLYAVICVRVVASKII